MSYKEPDPTFVGQLVRLMGHRGVYPDPPVLVREWVDDQLAALENQFQQTIRQSGYTADDFKPDGRAVREFTADAQRNPYAPANRIALALVGLDFLQELREELVSPTPSPENIARWALALGPLVNEHRTHARQIRFKRAQGLAGIAQRNTKKHQEKTRRLAKVHSLGQRIQAERARSEVDPLSNTALARQIKNHKDAPEAIKRLKLRTIQDYLSQKPT